MQNIFQLIYISHANETFLKDEEANIDDIITTAKEFNEVRGITGILLYRKGVFIQLLEGNKENVLQLYGLIASDFRHGNIKTLVKQHTDERIFKHWSMALKKLDNDDIAEVDLIYPWEELIHKSQSQIVIPKEKLLKVIQKFYYPAKK